MEANGNVIEWSNTNKYSSFNSYKGLTYYDNYVKILGWMDGKNELPPPIEASLDPMNGCNNSCYYCNSQRYLRDHPTKLTRWGRDFLEDTLIDLSMAGVKGWCWGGGGESLLNIRLPGMTKFGTDLGMECGIITNGIMLEGELADELLLARWIGVSLDSADPDVYKKVRGTDDCQRVLKNIEYVAKHRTKTDICVKVLVLPETIDSILLTCKVARDLGVQDFHVRPVDLERKDFKTRQQLNLDADKIRNIYDLCHQMETKDFHVYTVAHKFDENLHNLPNDFKCLASPLLKQICTDGHSYLCVDHRLESRFEVKEWGSDQHRELIKSIDPKTECSRCTFREYHKQIQAVKDDTLCMSFP